MRILVLDDDPERHKYFRRQFIGHDAVHTYTYKECMDALNNTEKFEVVFLDHDLNDHVEETGKSSPAEDRPDHIDKVLTRFSRPDELDGRCVAEDMTKLPPEKRPYQVIVHSWNPEGAKEMIATLRDAGYDRVIRWEFDPRQDLKINHG